MGNLEICTHACTLVIWISVHGCTHKGDKGTHGMHACFLHSCAWVCGYVVDKRAVMRAYVHDRGAWRRRCMADRYTLMCVCGMNRRAWVHACGMNRHTYVCACGVNRCTYVRTYGLNRCALETRLIGEKLIFFGDFNVFYG
jgi:hypothetical protein